MKLKGLVWFFTIALTLLSLWELSYTWVVRNYENSVKAKATKVVKKANPGLKGEALDAEIELRKRKILDSTSEQKIYPVFGTTYKQCKANELNLGLDLQGGISVTMDVSLTDLLKSLSNNSKNPLLLNAIQTATVNKTSSEADFITLFTDAFIKQNGSGKLASVFAGAEKEVKPNESDAEVITKLKKIASGAIKETYKVLVRRIDKFGVAQPNINYDENKGIINVELAGITDVERVRKQLQASARLQFWEVYNIDELAESLKLADANLQNYLNGVLPDSTGKIDSAKLTENVNPFFRIINPQNAQTDPASGKKFYPANIGIIAKTDTSLFYEYMNNPVVKNALPAEAKFLLGVPEKGGAKGTQEIFKLYVVKTLPGSEKAPLEGDGVSRSWQANDEKGKPSIKMDMTSMGSKAWARLTGKNVGRPVAISLDNIVYSAPNVISAIEGGSTEISGSFTVQEAQDLADLLQSGKLDAPAKIVAQQVVGPTLGAESVKGGAMSFGIAFLVIFILMLVYYNNGGWVANIALIFNLLFTIGVLISLQFTLTAAGIAGLVLTIGLAVDTNVIIFERIKEELTKGKSYPLAVNDGYRRSLAPVIDAHVTSLLTAFILFYFGLGPVLGFATTQIIGILLSLFCGILVSRLITEIWTNKNRHFNYFTALSKRIFKHANYKFIEYRKYAYMISVVVLIAGILSFFNGFHFGVEFKGGRSYTVQFDKTVKNDDIRDDLKKSFDNDNPTIKTVGDNRHLNITTAYLKDDERADSAVKTRLYEGLKKVLPVNTTYDQFTKNHLQAYSTVQPSISDDLKRGAVKATIFAILAIFLYIFIRFRDWRYSAGTIVTLLHDVFVTLAVFSFLKNIVPFPLEIDQHFIAAILTVIGFSMNDTVIVFDRIREYSRDMKGATKTTIINRAINDTLSRTIMTSLTVFLTILILFIFGGEVTRGFAFAMLIGVITGTYSSIFVGAPILVEFAKDKPLGAAAEVPKEKKKTV
ncbi:MAG: protein translocase subunit SecD [Ferruginibacter sp.]|nr:protein translocase subunit SecD [Ferruginibacter sp.]